MRFELCICIVVVAFYRRLFDCSAHPFDLTVGPGVVQFGQSVVDLMFATNAVECAALRPIAESSTLSRLRPFATVLTLMPNFWLSAPFEAFDRCIPPRFEMETSNVFCVRYSLLNSGAFYSRPASRNSPSTNIVLRYLDDRIELLSPGNPRMLVTQLGIRALIACRKQVSDCLGIKPNR